MANHALPTNTSLYTEVISNYKDRIDDVCKMLDPSTTTATNVPTNAIRWNSIGAKWEKFNGTAWSDLTTLYEIKVRDSDKLNGQSAAYYSVSSHTHSDVTTTANGFMSYTDKIKLNAIASNANNYSHPTGDGNFHVPENGTANNGKFLQATAVAGSCVWVTIPTVSLSTLGITKTAAEINAFSSVIPGTVITFASSTAPTGYLKCNGALLSRTTYAALFAAIGTTFGVGDGSTTFALPDLRGYFPRAWDDSRGVDTGRAFGSAQNDTYLNHSHTASAGTSGVHNHSTPQTANVGGEGNSYPHSIPFIPNSPLTITAKILTSSAGDHAHTVTVATSTTGGTETRPKNIALLYCIKF